MILPTKESKSTKGRSNSIRPIFILGLKNLYKSFFDLARLNLVKNRDLIFMRGYFSFLNFFEVR